MPADRCPALTPMQELKLAEADLAAARRCELPGGVVPVRQGFS